jgi:transposase-like protein
MTPSQAIPIARIRLDGGTQPRAAVDFEVVEEYCEAMQAGAKFPPVVTFYDGADYWLADGFHRVKAAYAADYDTIECEVHQGTQEQAQWHSFSANRTNGLRRTNQDKQRAVKAALQHPSGAVLSDRQIAKHVGVSDQMVHDYRHRLESTAKLWQSPRRTGRDGRTINVTNIGRSAPAKTTPAPAEQTHPSDPPPATTEDPDAPPTPARVTRAQKVDRMARLTLSFIEATKHLAHLVGWLGETAGEFEEAERLLSNAMSAIAAASTEIERRALEADPLNRDRLGIQEKRS